VAVGDDLGALLAGACDWRATDVLCVAHKVVSKAEGRIVALADVTPGPRALALAAEHGKDPRVVEVVLSESAEVVRADAGRIICRTRHGFVCANAGVDLSNVADGTAALLPVDPDRSARRLRADLRRALGVDVGVVISDTFGRPWRQGVTDVAIGSAGVAVVVDLRGTTDAGGRELVATEVCVADEIAAAAELVMGKDRHVPVAVVRGVPAAWLRDGSVADEVVRRAGDLFR